MMIPMKIKRNNYSIFIKKIEFIYLFKNKSFQRSLRTRIDELLSNWNPAVLQFSSACSVNKKQLTSRWDIATIHEFIQFTRVYFCTKYADVLFCLHCAGVFHFQTIEKRKKIFNFHFKQASIDMFYFLCMYNYVKNADWKK